MSVERGRQLGIALSIAHLYADVLNEPIPIEITRLIGYLDPPEHEPLATSSVDAMQQAGRS